MTGLAFSRVSDDAAREAAWRDTAARLALRGWCAWRSDYRDARVRYFLADPSGRFVMVTNLAELVDAADRLEAATGGAGVA